ncbi:MAG: putative permease [Conexibacter sp.]|nr:putative permease [Conexibacter sp.]
MTTGPDERLSAATLYRAILLAFGLVVIVLVFPQVATLLLLVLLTVIVSVPLAAATTRLQRLHVPRVVGAPLCLLAGIGVLVAIVALLVPTFRSEGNQLVRSLPSIAHELRRELAQVTHRPSSTVGSNFQHFLDGYTSHPQKLLGPATAVGAGVAGGITTLLAVVLTALYTAIRPDPLVNGLVRLVAPPKRSHAQRILRRLARGYLGWLRGLGLGMLVLWVATYLGLLLIGLPYAVVFATLTAIAMVVPYFGALVSAIPPILLALTISPSKALLVVAVYVLAHLIEGHIVEPLVMGHAVDLHPAAVVVGVLISERLFGFIGLVVAVPLIVTCKILVEELWVRPVESRYGGAGPPAVSARSVPHGDPADATRRAPAIR